MRTRVRTLLLLAVVVLVGLSLLAVLAKRYRGMTELRSVEDVVPVPAPAGRGAAAPAAPEPEPEPEPAPFAETARKAAPADGTGPPPGDAPAPPASYSETGESPEAQPEDPVLEAEAQGFLAVRRMVVAFIREHERDFERFLDPETGGLRHEMPRGIFEDMHRRGLVLSVKKYDVAKRHGIGLDDYIRWRSAFQSWRERGDVSSPEARWFAAHPESAEGLDLGRLELFDRATDPNVRDSSDH